MKATAKTIIGKAAQMPLVRIAMRRKLLKSTNIIYYHYFGEPSVFSDTYEDCSIQKFEADLRLIKEHFDFVPLASVLENHLSGREVNRPQIALTFDDGFDMFRNGVADLLDVHGIKATAFLTTACVDNGHLMWINKLTAIGNLRPNSCDAQYNVLMRKAGLPLAHDTRIKDVAMRTWPMSRKEELVNELWDACDMPALDEFLDQYRPYFRWTDIEEWLRRGHSVGLHTHTHPKCENIDEKLAEQEIKVPGKLLREKFGLPCLPLAYPFGSRLNPDLERKLYEEGAFDFAFGIRGFSLKGTEPYRMERVCGEDELEFSVFGKPLLK